MLCLPPELVLSIISHLPLNSLEDLCLVCHDWKSFIEEYEATIYRNAAFLHNYIPTFNFSFDDVGQLYSPRALVGVDSWKGLCRKRLQIKYNWKGKGPSRIQQYKTRKERFVHRFKVDEMAGFVIATYEIGGLTVTDLKGEEILWKMSPAIVRQYAHLEYDKGYMIFDRNMNSKEVWRIWDDFSLQEARRIDERFYPDQLQRSILQNDLREVQGNPPLPTRGYFAPWALLAMPENTRAFRFVYPILLVAAIERVYLWDVPTGRMIQTIENIQHISQNPAQDSPLGRLRYVELSEQHVFICGQDLRIFSRETGRLALNIPAVNDNIGAWRFVVNKADLEPQRPDSELLQVRLERRKVDRAQVGSLRLGDFNAVHVSSCGRHFVAQLDIPILIIVHDFEQVIRGEKTMFEAAICIHLSSLDDRSIYLAYENGRIAAVTQGGVYVVVVDPTTTGSLVTTPDVKVFVAPRFRNASGLNAISCLQMTDTGLFINWDPTEEGETGEPENEFVNHSIMLESLLLDQGILAHVDDGNPEDNVERTHASTVFSIDFD